MNTPFGFIIVNKPRGITSHDVVERLRRTTGIKKIGHTGTLDPLATGVLILCIGKATRLAQFIEAGEKKYKARLRLGATSDTYDREGGVIEKVFSSRPDISLSHLNNIVKKFVGNIEQVPPAFSAIKINGKPAYKKARAGEQLTMKPRRVFIQSIEILSYEWPHLDLQITCSKGTYIRSLAHDIGAQLKTGALLDALERTRVGQITISQAVNLEEVNSENWQQYLKGIYETCSSETDIVVQEDHILPLSQGKKISLENIDLTFLPTEDTLYFVFDTKKNLIALSTIDKKKHLLCPKKVFA